jgi:Zn-dependent M28 family amino/carboxypeptidase
MAVALWFVIAALALVNARQVSLSGRPVPLPLYKILAANPSLMPPDTEGRSISFASEEAGLRGSRRYVERHLDELTRLDARDETWK